jgi:transglutaminase-like putative cysteine protease
MPRMTVRHRTRYVYSAPVALGPQRLVLRPRDGHDLRLLDAALVVDPPAAATRWLYDVYDNVITVLEFAGETDALVVESRLLVDHYGLDQPAFAVEDYAQTWPFMYRPEEWTDLELWTRRQWSDPEGHLQRWVRALTLDRLEIPTQDLLVALMTRIKTELAYQVRHEEGVKPPLQTLAEGGSCRDFATLMIEAVRALGFAARFVSGYLYVPPPQGGAAAAVGGGATHAWVQVYLPGAGWVEFDPTNALYGGRDLIRVAIARDPAAVAPVGGSFTGPAGVATTLEVEVAVELLETPAASLAEAGLG